MEPPNSSFFSTTGWGIDLNYYDIEWFALEMKRDHSVIFETQHPSTEGSMLQMLHSFCLIMLRDIYDKLAKVDFDFDFWGIST